MVQLNSRDLRLDYDTAKLMLVEANYAPRDASGKYTGQELSKEQVMKYMNELDDEEITQGYVETAATLLPASQIIKFTIVDTQQVANSPVLSIMKLLTMQDSFLVSTMSYFLRVYDYSFQPNFGSPSWPGNDWSPITFPDVWKGGTTAPALDPGCGIFWFGSNLSFTINKKVLMPAIDCYRFYRSPSMQSVNGLSTPNWFQNFSAAHDGSTDGYYPVVPYFVIGGGRDNDIRLNLASNIPADMAPFNDISYNNAPGMETIGFVLQAVLSFRGIQMQNSTSVK